MKCLTEKNLEISPAFVLLLCLFFYADPWGLFGPFLLAAFCHELGHVVACWAVGAPVQQLRIGFGGAVLQTPPMSYPAECLCTLAGPLVNLILCLALLRLWPAFALINFLLAVYNMLPLAPLDGGRALRCLLLMLTPPVVAERILQGIHALLWAVLAAGSWYLSFYCRAGVWPVLLLALLIVRSEGEIFVAKRRERS